VGVTAGVFVLWPRPSRVTRENFDRITEGMTAQEVEAIHGPPGDYTTGQTAASSIFPQTGQHGDAGGLSTHWGCDTGGGVVYFDGRGRVRFGGFIPYTRQAQNPLADLLWRAKRQWHRWFPE
jgi:hypothetical protein